MSYAPRPDLTYADWREMREVPVRSVEVRHGEYLHAWGDLSEDKEACLFTLEHVRYWREVALQAAAGVRPSEATAIAQDLADATTSLLRCADKKPRCAWCPYGASAT